jgi:hypothetical protein
MGHNGPNPDRWPIAAWKARCQNIGQMLEDDWEVFAYCPKCRTRLWVNLKALRKAMGRNFILWNRTVRCRAADWSGARCSGRAHFEAKPGGLNRMLKLECTEPEGGARPKMRQQCRTAG